MGPMLFCPWPIGQAAATAPVPFVTPVTGHSGECRGYAVGQTPGRVPCSPAAEGTARGQGHKKRGKSNQTPSLPILPRPSCSRVLVETTCDRTAVCAVIYPQQQGIKYCLFPSGSEVLSFL